MVTHRFYQTLALKLYAVLNCQHSNTDWCQLRTSVQVTLIYKIHTNSRMIWKGCYSLWTTGGENFWITTDSPSVLTTEQWYSKIYRNQIYYKTGCQRPSFFRCCRPRCPVCAPLVTRTKQTKETWHCTDRVSSCNIYAVQQDTQCGLNE